MDRAWRYSDAASFFMRSEAGTDTDVDRIRLLRRAFGCDRQVVSVNDFIIRLVA